MKPRDLNTFSDEQLLDLLKRDDRMAFTKLYERHWEKLFKAAFNVLRAEDVSKDTIQEVFLTIWRNRHTQQINSFSAYSFQAVKFQVAHVLRRGKLTREHTETLAGIRMVNTTEELMDLHELNGLLEKSLSRLPEKCRDVFFLSRFEQLSNVEIAARLDLSTRTVEWHISNALKHLRHSIDDVAVLFCFALLF